MFIPDPGSASALNYLSILSQKIVSKLSELLAGLFIQDPDYLPIPDPGVKKAPDPGSQIPISNTVKCDTLKLF
jgi:hypothetical protein